MSVDLILAVIALILAIVDTFAPRPFLLNLGVVCLALAIIV